MSNEKPFNIQQRTFEFGLNIVNLSESLPRSQTGKVLCTQLVRSGTSIGANMEEAAAAEARQILSIKQISLFEKPVRKTIGCD